jgi:hypothetical protein
MTKLKQFTLRFTAAAITNGTVLALLAAMTFGNTVVFAQTMTNDPGLEVFRIRCQIDTDINPVTGLEATKVQIQAKTRADLLDGFAVGIMVENISAVNPPLPSVINTVFAFGSATADWNTFPGIDASPVVKVIPGDFVSGGESIKVTAQVTSTGQTVTAVGDCADKTASQFKQQTKNVCTLVKFNRGKCKSGQILPDGTVQP